MPARLFDLYMKYGSDYKSPCMRHVIEKLNDEATKYTANRFFTKRDEISLQMQTALN